jgi:hypothetical protein
MRATLRKWRYATVLLTAHAILLLIITVGFATSRDPNVGMLWIFPYAFDFPSSLVSERVLRESASLTAHIVVYLILGGIQWMLLGSIFDLVIGSLPLDKEKQST